MNLADDLYQELILDHARMPRNKGELNPHSHHARGLNPLCGDEVEVFLDIRDDLVRDVRFKGHGCAISTASASMMTQQIRGMPVHEVKTLLARVNAMVTGRSPADESLGKLVVLAGVSRFPTRVKCASLAWHALAAALSESGETVVAE